MSIPDVTTKYEAPTSEPCINYPGGILEVDRRMSVAGRH